MSIKNNRRIFIFHYMLILIGCLFSCMATKNHSHLEKSIISIINMRDMNISAIMEYVRYENKDCRDSCEVLIDGVIDLIDDCHWYGDSLYLKRIGWDTSTYFKVGPKNFVIDDFGTISFGIPNKETEVDYTFSPVVYDRDKASLTGQVLKKDGRKEFIGFNIVNDKIYLSYTLEYVYKCNPWEVPGATRK